ncbi:hypothetical protein [Salegentibacter chungangensis]|uniref:Cyclase n=1 Tax=Salegentibacter chungangensis TaxID=1335724 RepID=A0ABW3NS42_9FLAO
MAVAILSHKVKDYKNWKPFYEKDVKRRESAGIQEIFVGQQKEDPNNVYMIWRIGDPGKIQKMLDDPELKKVMDEAGVQSRPQVTIIE